jgi:hypothetical protein
MVGEGQRREKPERLEIPRKQKGLRPGLIVWGAKEEDGFQGGDKPLKRGCKAGMVLHTIAGVDKEGWETILDHLGGEKL